MTSNKKAFIKDELQCSILRKTSCAVLLFFSGSFFFVSMSIFVKNALSVYSN